MDQQTTTPLPGARLRPGIIVIAVIALCAAGLGVFALDRAMRQRRDRQTVQWADKAMAEGRYGDAAALFARAVARHPDDADLSIKSGDAFYALSASQPESLQEARVAWEAAARISPNNLIPLRRLLQLNLDWVEVRPSAAAFRELGDVARKIAAISPEDKGAAAAGLVARLGPWFSEGGAIVNAQSAEHDQLLSELGAFQRQDAAEPQVIIYCALARSRRAIELQRAGANARAREPLDDAEQQIAQFAAHPGERDSQLLYRAAEGMAVLAQTHELIDQLPASQPKAIVATQPATTQLATPSPRVLWPTWDLLNQRVNWAGLEIATDSHGIGTPTTRPSGIAAARCRREAQSFVERAAGSATLSDAHFLDTRLLESTLAQANGDFAGAERICREALASRPGSRRVQLSLAHLVGRSHPEQAMAILDQPEKVDDAGPGPVALLRPIVLAEAARQQARLHLDAAASTDDELAREAHVQQATAACQTLASMLVNDSESMKLTGRLRMLQGRYADALHSLDRAIAMSHAQGRGNLDLFEYRATTLLALHEPDLALENLRAVLEADPTRSNDRLTLAGTLIDLARTTETTKQVDRLDQQIPGDARVLALRVRLLIAKNAIDPDPITARQIQEKLATVPEGTTIQKLAKAELSISAGAAADAVRLMGAARKEAPDSIPVALEGVKALVASNTADQARVLLNDALARHPNDRSLLAAQKSLEGPTPVEAYERTLGGEDAAQLLAAIHACRAALDSRDLPRAKEQLETGKRLRADEPLLLDLQFQYDLATRQWSEAGLGADKLAENNFDHMEGLTYRIALQKAQEQLLAAVCTGRQMTLRYGRVVDSWLDYGDALQSVGQYDRAIDSFREALAMDRQNLRAITGTASCFEATGRTPEAEKWIADGRKLAPGDAQLREMELRDQLTHGDPRRLIAGREFAMQSEPQRPDNVIALARVYLQINRNETLADAKSAHEAAAKAVEILGGAVKKWPDDKDCYFWAAHASAVAGDVAGGKQILRRLCERTAWATRPDAEQLLADFCLTWGDPPSAEAAMREAMKRGADGPPMARRLAGVLLRQGAWRPALEALNRFPADPLTQQQRLAIFLAAGNAAEAEKELQNALAANPGNPRVITLLGMLYAAERNETEATRWLDRAVAVGGEDLADRERGALRLKTGADTAGAIREISTAWEARLSDVRAATLLSQAWLRGGDQVRAAQVLETGLTITPWEGELRRSLVALEEGRQSPNWEKVASLISEGRLLAPSDLGWDALEAQLWMSRHEPAKAAALMRHAVQLAETAPLVADATMERRDALKIRPLIPEELWMLLAAHAHDLAVAEADDVISRYGGRDMLSAWAHHARAAVQRRTGAADGGAAEYNTAIAIAQSVGGYKQAAAIVETISAEAGADEAIRRINGYLAAVDGARGDRAAHDPHWDLLRIDLLRRNTELPAAAAEIDKIMTRLDSLPPAAQIDLLRLAVVVYLQDASSVQTQKARAACLALLQRRPDDAWALNNMAIFCIDPSRPSDLAEGLDYGLRAYQSAGRAGEVDPRIADTYGWALAAAGRGEEAIQILAPLAGQLPIPEVQYHLAEAYLSTENAAGAWPHLATAVQLIGRDERAGVRVDPGLRSGVARAFWRALRGSAKQGLGILLQCERHPVSNGTTVADQQAQGAGGK